MSSVRPIYLDHGATAFPKAPGVTDAMVRFLADAAGNPGRGGHRLTVAASRTIEGAREEVAALLGGDPERTLFGPGATFWINTILNSRLEPGSRVVISALEHNAVMRPLRWLEAHRGVEIAVVAGSGSHGVPTADEVAARVAEKKTALVVLTHASNLTGAVLPVAEVVAAVAPVPVVVDAAQTVGSLRIDFAALGAAALVCSGHKGLLGPPGIGVMLLAPAFDIEPLVRGGTGSHSESEMMPEDLPDRLEAGHPQRRRRRRSRSGLRVVAEALGPGHPGPCPATARTVGAGPGRDRQGDVVRVERGSAAHRGAVVQGQRHRFGRARSTPRP